MHTNQVFIESVRIYKIPRMNSKTTGIVPFTCLPNNCFYSNSRKYKNCFHTKYVFIKRDYYHIVPLWLSTSSASEFNVVQNVVVHFYKMTSVCFFGFSRGGSYIITNRFLFFIYFFFLMQCLCPRPATAT
jgi:hypothetical protein